MPPHIPHTTIPMMRATLTWAKSIVSTLRIVLAACENRMMYREFCAASLVSILKK